MTLEEKLTELSLCILGTDYILYNYTFLQEEKDGYVYYTYKIDYDKYVALFRKQNQYLISDVNREDKFICFIKEELEFSELSTFGLEKINIAK